MIGAAIALLFVIIVLVASDNHNPPDEPNATT